LVNGKPTATLVDASEENPLGSRFGSGADRSGSRLRNRFLKTGGALAVWMFPIYFGVPEAISRSGLFINLGKKNGVYTFRRSED